MTLPISFAQRVKADVSAPAWSAAEPSAFQLDCFWAQVVTSAGAPVFGQPNACEYVSLSPTPSGMQLTFLGGRLCAGCTLTGSTGSSDATLNVKHTSYLLMDASTPPALGPISCAPPAAPPARCASSAAPPAQ